MNLTPAVEGTLEELPATLKGITDTDWHGLEAAAALTRLMVPKTDDDSWNTDTLENNFYYFQV